jgi:hypothetical protein
MFRIGQRVVFVGPDLNGKPLSVYYRLQCPIPKEIYTLRSGRMFFLGQPGYLLTEIVNEPIAPLTTELLIDERWLRPLVERKTDISVFTAMLIPTKEKVM